MGKGAAVYGFSQELFLHIGQDYGVSFIFQPVAYEGLINSLETAQCDGVLSTMAPVLQFRKDFDFSAPYLYTGLVLVVRMDENATSIADMSGKEIGIPYDDISTLTVGLPNDVAIRSYTDVNVALQLVASKAIDGVVMPLIPAYAYCKDFYAGVLQIASEPLNDASLKLVVLGGHNAPLIELFNTALAELRKSGAYDQLLAKWDLSPPELQ